MHIYIYMYVYIYILLYMRVCTYLRMQVGLHVSLAVCRAACVSLSPQFGVECMRIWKQIPKTKKHTPKKTSAPATLQRDSANASPLSSSPTAPLVLNGCASDAEKSERLALVPSVKVSWLTRPSSMLLQVQVCCLFFQGMCLPSPSSKMQLQSKALAETCHI